MSALFDGRKEPPVGEDGNTSLSKHQPTGAYDGQAEKCSAAHRPLRVVHEAENARIVQLGRIILDEEIAVEPAKRPKSFVGRS